MCIAHNLDVEVALLLLKNVLQNSEEVVPCIAFSENNSQVMSACIWGKSFIGGSTIQMCIRMASEITIHQQAAAFIVSTIRHLNILTLF